MTVLLVRASQERNTITVQYFDASYQRFTVEEFIFAAANRYWFREPYSETKRVGTFINHQRPMRAEPTRRLTQ